MHCQYCGKEVWGIRGLLDRDFCTPAHRRQFAERIRRALQETPQARLPESAGFVTAAAGAACPDTPALLAQPQFQPVASTLVPPSLALRLNSCTPVPRLTADVMPQVMRCGPRQVFAGEPAAWCHRVQAVHVLPHGLSDRLEALQECAEPRMQPAPQATVLPLPPAAAAPGGEALAAVPLLQRTPSARIRAAAPPLRVARPITAGALPQQWEPQYPQPRPVPMDRGAFLIHSRVPPIPIDVMPRFMDEMPTVEAQLRRPERALAGPLATLPLPRTGRADLRACPAIPPAPSNLLPGAGDLQLCYGLLRQINVERRPRRKLHLPAFTARQYQMLAASILMAAMLPFAFTGAQTRGRTLEFEDDFRSGLANWKGAGAGAWRVDPKGFARPGALALFAPSLDLSDYRLEFRALLEGKALGWVYRASDTQNYHAVVLRRLKSGAVSLERYSVIDGKRDAPTRVPLVTRKWNDKAAFDATLVAGGNQFGLWINGERVDGWEDTRLQQGGAGFFGDTAGRSRIYRVRLAVEGRSVQSKEEKRDARLEFQRLCSAVRYVPGR